MVHAKKGVNDPGSRKLIGSWHVGAFGKRVSEIEHNQANIILQATIK